MKPSYKIVIRGGYGLTNFGDDALMKSLHDDFKKTFSYKELAYNCTYSSYLERIIGNYTVIPLKIKDIPTNLLLYGGGTQFYSFERNNIRDKIQNNIQTLKNPIKLIRKLFEISKRIFQKRKKTYKTAAVGIGVGPFLPTADPSIEINVSNLFKRMDFVAVRDSYSYEKCKEWGIKKVNLYSDLCFNMKSPFFYNLNDKTEISNIGIIVRDWERTKTGRAYYENLLHALSDLKTLNIDFHFFLFSKDKDKNWEHILNTSSVSYMQWDPEKYSIDDFIIELSKMDSFISARYHGAIFSALLGKPFITIDVEQKLELVNKLFSQGSLNWGYPYISDELVENVRKINESYKSFSNSIYNICIDQRTLANKMRDDLFTYLTNF